MALLARPGRSAAEMYSGLLINLCLTEVNVWKRTPLRRESTCYLSTYLKNPFFRGFEDITVINIVLL